MIQASWLLVTVTAIVGKVRSRLVLGAGGHVDIFIQM